MALLFVVRGRTDDAAYREKGGAASTGAAFLDLGCAGGTRAACPYGATLVFSVLRAAEPGFLGAYAEPRGTGERVWYFASEGESPQVLPSSEATRTAARGIHVGREHRQGQFVVYVYLSRRPLSRSELVDGTNPAIFARATFPLTIVQP
jgi:hypothetical protein